MNSPNSDIKLVGVMGAGQMGLGIAQTAATAGFNVMLQDISADALIVAVSRIEQSIDKLIEKGKLGADVRNGTLGRISTSRAPEDFKNADLVIEAVSEDPSLKFDLFIKLDRICKEGAILASNTSSISITEIAAKTKRAENVIGLHFMNPVPVMKLVEVIRGLKTSQSTFLSVKAFSECLGKVCVESKDYSGFIVNRILMPMINEAIYALFEGLASIEDIDNAMKLGTNQPMGPLTLADFIGLDTCLSIMKVLHEGLGDSKYRPCPLLKQYVSAGMLGRKTGQGFYKYEVQKPSKLSLTV